MYIYAPPPLTSTLSYKSVWLSSLYIELSCIRVIIKINGLIDGRNTELDINW